MTMTATEAVELAGLILKQSNGNVTAKPGVTNGEGRVHVRDGKRSETLTDAAQWDNHPLNRKNAPRKPKKAKRKDEANQATIDSHTIYSPEN